MIQSPPDTLPKVSVLMPVRNGANTIERALNSLIQQTLEQIEIIIVDDGSKDETLSIIEGLATNERRLRIAQQRPMGIVSALNKAASMAKAPYLARMDADDFSYPERLSLQVQMLDAQPVLDGVGCKVRCVGETVRDGWLQYEKWLNELTSPKEIHENIFVESPLPHPSMMVRRSAFERNGGYRNFDGPEDYDLWLRMVLGKSRFAKVPRVLLDWHDRPNRLTRTDPRYRTEAFVNTKALYLAKGPLATPLTSMKQRPLLIWGAGRYGKNLVRALRKQDIPIDAFIDVDKAKIGHHRQGIPVHPPEDIKTFGIPLVLSAVPVPNARNQIKQWLKEHGFVEGEDFWACA